MGQIFDATVNFFKERQWPFIQLGDRTILHMMFEGTNGSWECYADAREDQHRLLFYSLAPIMVPEARRQAMAEFITRANYGMMIGNFEMDFDDGEVRYKTSIDVDGEQLSSGLIFQLVSANVFTMDKYLPGIRAVVDQDVPPIQAVQSVEAPSPQGDAGGTAS
jgi:hypothetical protein